MARRLAGLILGLIFSFTAAADAQAPFSLEGAMGAAGIHLQGFMDRRGAARVDEIEGYSLASLASRPLSPDEQAALPKIKEIMSRGGGVLPQEKAFLDSWFPTFHSLGMIGRPPTADEKSQTESWFPKLAERGDWRVTGEPCYGYNCISWSVGVTDDWLWPGENVASFDALYKSYGYVPLKPGEPESKADIALWVDSGGGATHGCRRVSGEWWESKLGRSLRVLHKLHDLTGNTYGHVHKFYRRASAEELNAPPLTPGGYGQDPCPAQ